VIASLSAEADRELAEAAAHYAQEASPELALAFVVEFERTVGLLRTHPQIGAPWKRGRRRFRLFRFPYSIVYYVKGDELRIIAVAHHRRRPGYWAGRN
jgi:plasmid stabilization system protein ParE